MQANPPMRGELKKNTPIPNTRKIFSNEIFHILGNTDVRW